MEATLPNGDIHLEVDNHDNQDDCLACHKPVSLTDIKAKIGSGLEFSKNIGNINCKPDFDPVESQLQVEISQLDLKSEETSDKGGKQDLNSFIPFSDDQGENKCEAEIEEEDKPNSSSSNPKDELADKESQQLEKPVSVPSPIRYEVYKSEEQMPDIMQLITKDLSEPYSVYTYRYFIHNWPKLCFLAIDGTAQKESGQEKCVGAIVCKLDMHKNVVRRGYIAMLAVDHSYRRRKIGSHLVMKAIKAMVADNCDEVVLETEITNKPALRLYENLGFVRDKRLFRYYLNGVDALRLKLWLR